MMVRAKFTDLPSELLYQILEIPPGFSHNPRSSSNKRILRTASLVNRSLAAVARPALFYDIVLPYRSSKRFVAFIEAIIASQSLQRWIRSLSSIRVPWDLVPHERSLFADAVALLSSIKRLEIDPPIIVDEEDGETVVGGWDMYPLWFRQPVEETIFPKLVHLRVANIHGFPYNILFHRSLSLKHLELSLDAPPTPLSSAVTTTPLTICVQRPRLWLSIGGERAPLLVDNNSGCSPLSSLHEAGVELGHLALENPQLEGSAISSLFRPAASLRVFEMKCYWDYDSTPTTSYVGLDLSSLHFLETLIFIFDFSEKDHKFMNKFMETLADVVSTAIALRKLRLHVRHSFSYLMDETTKLQWGLLDEVIARKSVDMIVISFRWFRERARGINEESISVEETSAMFRDAVPLAASSGKLRIYELWGSSIPNEYCSVCQSS